jgi:K+-transporting ATPase ATPase C chain
VKRGTNLLGSVLLAQRTTGPTYFWPRPSAGDDGTNYVTVASSASNKGPTAGDWTTNVVQRIDDFRRAHAVAPGTLVPAEMVFASGSGLDPHISPASARLQLPRVAMARKLDAQQRQRLEATVDSQIEPPTFGLLGEPRINVLRLNLALDEAFPAQKP